MQSSATVSLARIKGRSEKPGLLRDALQQVLQPLGGLTQFVRPGNRVLIKPNQTLFRHELTGSTTSPRLIRQIIAMAFEAGAREVWVAEAAGHAQMTRNVAGRTGLAAAVKETGAHMIYLDEIAQKIHDFGGDEEATRYMPIPEILERADVIIDVPKAKTHFVDPISCACKNWVGVMPMAYRLYLQRLGEPYYRGTALLLRDFRPTLTIVDGAIAGEGQGPGQNHPFWWGWLLASTDPVAIDVTVCRLFSLDWQKLRMTSEAARAGVGVFDPMRIELIGGPFEKAKVKVKAADPSVHRYPCRVLEGRGATIEGTLGHWKTIADAWLENGLWTLFCSRGTPTFMFGDVDDPDFEKHVEEGPYVVLDDSAQDRYKYDERVVFVPGSPVPQSYIQHEMVEGMGFGELYQPGMKLFQKGSSLTAKLRGAAGRKVQVKTALTGAAVLGGVAALVAARRRT